MLCKPKQMYSPYVLYICICLWSPIVFHPFLFDFGAKHDTVIPYQTILPKTGLPCEIHGLKNG